MKRLTTEQLEAIRKRAEAATAGPWRDNFGSFIDGIEVWADGGCVLSAEGGVLRYSDAEFITASREDILALLAEVERLQAEVMTQAERSIMAENALTEIEDVISGFYTEQGGIRLPAYLSPKAGEIRVIHTIAREAIANE